jgi:hypothetical protein
MNVLVFSCGSSSQNFKAYEVLHGAEPTLIASGKATTSRPGLRRRLGSTGRSAGMKEAKKPISRRIAVRQKKVSGPSASTMRASTGSAIDSCTAASGSNSAPL